MTIRHTLATTILASLLQLALTGSCFAVTSKDIRSGAETFLLNEISVYTEKGFRVEYEIGKLSPSLNLSKCSHTIEYSLKRDIFRSASNTIDVSCTAPRWQIFIPSEIEVYGKAVAAATSIRKNAKIRASDMHLVERQVNSNRYGSYADLEQVVGMIAKRTIRQGSIVKPSHLRPPMVIARGDEVLIQAKSGPIAIQMKGEALSAGVVGEQISVKNVSSNRIIRAQVIEKGRVSVLL